MTTSISFKRLLPISAIDSFASDRASEQTHSRLTFATLKLLSGLSVGTAAKRISLRNERNNSLPQREVSERSQRTTALPPLLHRHVLRAAQSDKWAVAGVIGKGDCTYFDLCNSTHFGRRRGNSPKAGAMHLVITLRNNAHWSGVSSITKFSIVTRCFNCKT
jgi:hypothetical protein